MRTLVGFLLSVIVSLLAYHFVTDHFLWVVGFYLFGYLEGRVTEYFHE